MQKSKSESWYVKLNDYFPEHEMKHEDQLKDLIEDKDVYHKIETDQYVLLYAEFPEFIFIDYVLVLEEARGQGIGTHVLEQLKQKNKLILLEAEPADSSNIDTEKRIQFYTRNGFRLTQKIQYVREDDDGDPYEMKILYWSPQPENEKNIFAKMEKACKEIHNYRSQYYYGRTLADPEEVLNWDKQT